MQPCLTGNSKTIVICTLNQIYECIGESINTLKFGMAANSVKMTICKNVVNSVVRSKKRSDEAKYEDLCEMLDQERAYKREILNELSHLRAKNEQMREFEDKAVEKINKLEYQL